MKRWIALMGALVSILALGSAPAFAQDARVEAAKKEGKVVWYTSLALPTADKVAKLFEAAYPGIKVEVHRTGSQRMLQRVMQELQANLKLVDVIHTSDAGYFVLLKEKKLLMKYKPAGVDTFSAGLKDKDGDYFTLRATVNVIDYNTTLVSAAAAPETWKDLLDPKWKGQLVTAHSRLQSCVRGSPSAAPACRKMCARSSARLRSTTSSCPCSVAYCSPTSSTSSAPCGWSWTPASVTSRCSASPSRP